MSESVADRNMWFGVAMHVSKEHVQCLPPREGPDAKQQVQQLLTGHFSDRRHWIRTGVFKIDQRLGARLRRWVADCRLRSTLDEGTVLREIEQYLRHSFRLAEAKLRRQQALQAQQARAAEISDSIVVLTAAVAGEEETSGSAGDSGTAGGAC